MTEKATFRAVKVGAVMIRGRYWNKLRIWGRGAGNRYHVTPPNYRTSRRTWMVCEDAFAGPEVVIDLCM